MSSRINVVNYSLFHFSSENVIRDACKVKVQMQWPIVLFIVLKIKTIFLEIIAKCKMYKEQIDFVIVWFDDDVLICCKMLIKLIGQFENIFADKNKYEAFKC